MLAESKFTGIVNKAGITESTVFKRRIAVDLLGMGCELHGVRGDLWNYITRESYCYAILQSLLYKVDLLLTFPVIFP